MRRKTRVATRITGSVAKANNASDRSITSSTTMMPTKVTNDTTDDTRPVCRKLDRASMSVVIRVRMRPVCCRS